MHSGIRDTRPIEQRDTQRSQSTATSKADAQFIAFCSEMNVAFFFQRTSYCHTARLMELNSSADGTVP